MHSKREYLVEITKRYKNMYASVARVHMHNALANAAVKAVLIGGAALIEGMNGFLIAAVSIEILFIHGFKYNSLQRLISYFGYCAILGIAALNTHGNHSVILSVSAALMNVMILAYFLMPRATQAKQISPKTKEKAPLFSIQFDKNGQVVSRSLNEAYPVLNAVRSMPEFLACFNDDSVNMLRLALHSMKLHATPTSVMAVFHGSSYVPVMVKFDSLNSVHIYEIAPLRAITQHMENSRNLHKFQAITPSDMNDGSVGRSLLSHTTIGNTAVSRTRTRSSIAM